MEEIDLTFLFDVNVSLALGDIVYYKPSDGEGGFTEDNIRLGNVTAIGDRTITINRPLDVDVPSQGDFIWFSKDSEVETSGIIGYEAMVTMINTQLTKAELFAISSEVFESSK